MLLDQIGRRLAFAAGRAELDVELARELRNDRDNRDQGGDPGNDDAPATAIDEICKTCKTGCWERRVHAVEATDAHPSAAPL